MSVGWREGQPACRKISLQESRKVFGRPIYGRPNLIWNDRRLNQTENACYIPWRAACQKLLHNNEIRGENTRGPIYRICCFGPLRMSHFTRYCKNTQHESMDYVSHGVERCLCDECEQTVICRLSGFWSWQLTASRTTMRGCLVSVTAVIWSLRTPPLRSRRSLTSSIHRTGALKARMHALHFITCFFCDCK